MARALLGRRDQSPAMKTRWGKPPRSINKISRSLVASVVAARSTPVGNAVESPWVAADLNKLVRFVYNDGNPWLISCLKSGAQLVLTHFDSSLPRETGLISLTEVFGEGAVAKFRFLPGAFGHSAESIGMAIYQRSPLTEVREMLCTTLYDDQRELQFCVTGPIEEGRCVYLNLLKTSTGEARRSDSFSTMMPYIILGVCSGWVIAYAHDLLQNWFRRRALDASPTSELRDSFRSLDAEASNFFQVWEKSREYASNEKQKKFGAVPVNRKIPEKCEARREQVPKSANNTVVDNEESPEELGSRSIIEKNLKQTLEGNSSNVDNNTLQAADSNRTNVNNESSEALQISQNEVVHEIKEKRNHVDGRFKRRRLKKEKEPKNGAEKGKESKNGAEKDKESKNGAEKEKQRRKRHK